MPNFGLKSFEDPDPREYLRDSSANLPLDSNMRVPQEDSSKTLEIQGFEFPDNFAFRRYMLRDEWIGDVILPGKKEKTKDADQILLPNRVFGFVFQTRTWSEFHMIPLVAIC